MSDRAYGDPYSYTQAKLSRELNDHAHTIASIPSDSVTAIAKEMDPTKQIMDDLANMGEHPQDSESVTLTDLLNSIQDVIRKHLQEHYEKELLIGSNKEDSMECDELDSLLETQEYLDKIIKAECACPSIEYGANHSASCSKYLARKARFSLEKVIGVGAGPSTSKF